MKRRKIRAHAVNLDEVTFRDTLLLAQVETGVGS